MSQPITRTNRTLDDSDRFLEECSSCGRETPHSVSIEIRQESTKQNHVEYSREPYRVSVCEECDTTERLRMNDQ